MEILYSGAGHIIPWFRLRRRPFVLCAHGTMPESSWPPCATPDRPSRRPTAPHPSPAHTT